MHKVLTSRQLSLLREIVEHLSTKKDRKITITEFLEACRYKSTIEVIFAQMSSIESTKKDADDSTLKISKLVVVEPKIEEKKPEPEVKQEPIDVKPVVAAINELNVAESSSCL